MINIDTRLLEKLDANELYLLCRITNRIGANKESWPSNDLLLKECGWHIEKLLKVKNGLESKGILKVTRKPGRANRYSLATNLIGNYVNGKSEGVENSDATDTENPSTPAPENPAATTTENPSEPLRKNHTLSINQEALVNEELTTEELDREKRGLFRRKSLIFEKLIEVVYPQFEEYNFFYADPDYVINEQGLKDPTIIATLKKIVGAAEKLYSAFEQLNRPIPDYRDIGMISSKDEPDAVEESVDQLCAYFDYCDLTGTYTTKDPDKLCEKLIQTNWCEQLMAWADEKVKNEEYDPAYDDSILSQWLVERYYCVVISYSCRRYNDRMVYGRTEFLATKDSDDFETTGKRKPGTRAPRTQPVKPNQYQPRKFVQ
ncbi:MAG TPA: hypothetical protein VGD40_10125 [Chryseosolibacter sp.]